MNARDFRTTVRNFKRFGTNNECERLETAQNFVLPNVMFQIATMPLRARESNFVLLMPIGRMFRSMGWKENRGMNFRASTF